MPISLGVILVLASRSSHEERGLKWLLIAIELLYGCRSSHEERGLKYDVVEGIYDAVPGRSSHEERGLK